jgi:hypothetical protein
MLAVLVMRPKETTIWLRRNPLMWYFLVKNLDLI